MVRLGSASSAITCQLGWSTRAEVAGDRAADAIHQSLLSGLLSHIGARDGNTREFKGARGTRFMIFPGSSLAKKPPEFLMAAELVETSRLWARDVAKIEPAWVEKLAGPLLKHQHSEPSWSRKRASGIAHQKSTLYGVTIVADRIVPYHRVDAEAARDMFIRHALIEGDWTTHHTFFHSTGEARDRRRNRGKGRRRASSSTRRHCSTSTTPACPSITTGRHFDSWWKKERQKNPGLLDFDPESLLGDEAESITEEAFPDRWRKGSIVYDLEYRFEPGHPQDGVTILVPVPLLAGMDREGFDWLVPGLREELLTELIRTLPKDKRRTVVPAPDVAARALPGLVPTRGPSSSSSPRSCTPRWPPHHGRGLPPRRAAPAPEDDLRCGGQTRQGHRRRQGPRCAHPAPGRLVKSSVSKVSRSSRRRPCRSGPPTPSAPLPRR